MKTKKFYETDEAKRTIKEWNKKLKDSGFKDIEYASDIQSNSITGEKITINHASFVYFQKCCHYLNQTTFKDPVDQFIFEKHCEGMTNRQIVIELTNSNLKQLKLSAVSERILRILKNANIAPMIFNF